MTHTFMQSLVGHAVDVARAALWDEPPHDCVHTGLPVRAPHASTERHVPKDNVNDSRYRTTRQLTLLNGV